MTRRRKHVILTIAAQVGCLAVGLWMQERFLESSIIRQALEAEWTQLGHAIGRLPNSALASTGRPALRDPTSLSEGTIIPGHDGGEAMIVTIADSQWRLQHTTLQGADPEILVPGNPLDWTREEGNEPANAATWCGTLRLSEGVHIAVARPLPSGGYLIVHRPREHVIAAARQLLTFVPTLSVLALIWTSALLGVSAYMLLTRFHDEAERDRAKSLAEGLRQRQDLIRTRDAVVFGLAKLADSRDGDTGDHLERISVYSTMLASLLRRNPKYATEVTPAFVRLIGISSALHDIGKVGVEDCILLKPSSLTPEERTRMEAHAVIGGECLREIEQRLGSSNFLHMARDIAFAHHERWDGKGYPHGLQGEQIPLAARIVAIADVYDALSSRRIYKEPRSHEECVRIINAAAGSHFDPDLVQTWLTLAPKFAETAARYSKPQEGEARIAPPTENAANGADTAISGAVNPGRGRSPQAKISPPSSGTAHFDEAIAPA